MIKVILTQEVSGQGKKGEIINVSNGFARNFLLPQNKAVIATDETIQNAKKEQEAKLEEEKRLSEKNTALKKQLESLSLEIKKKTQDKKLFGSVSEKEITAALEERGITISPKNITVKEPVKSVGKHIIGIVLDKNTKAKLKIEVSGE